MRDYFTIIGFGPLGVPHVNTCLTQNQRPVRSYLTLGTARAARTNMDTSPGIRYRILKTTIAYDGEATTEWVD